MRKIFLNYQAKNCLNLKIEYKLVGIIIDQKINHYNAIFFNLVGWINTNFNPNNIYCYDRMIKQRPILTLKKGEDWKNIGIFEFYFI